jgi:protein O-GlcNAc transferase
MLYCFMDFQAFVGNLPGLYKNWGNPSVQPVSDQFEIIPEQFGGTAAVQLMQLLNAAVGCLSAMEIYCEIGCAWGTNLIAALLDHPGAMAYAVENPNRVGPQGEMVDRLMAHLHNFGLQEQVFFCCQEMEEFFADLRDAALEDKIGVYFYNSSADYRSQLLALLLAKPFLADQALIILNQADLGTMRQAVWDFLAVHSQAELLLDLSAHSGNSAFGQGVLVLGWNVNSSPSVKTSDQQQWWDELTISTLQKLEQQQQVARLEVLIKEATLLAVEGRMEAAEDKYQTALLYDANNVEVWQNLGMLYYLTGNNDAALNALTTSLELNSQNVLTHHILGLVLERQELIDQAIEAYQQAIILNPSYVVALNSLGRLFLKQGEFKRAEALFQQAIAATPDQDETFVNLGDSLMGQEQPKLAIETYKKAVNLNLQNSAAWKKLSAACAAIGDADGAHLSSIYALYFQDRHEEAIEYFQHHFKIDQLQTAHDCWILHDCFLQCGYTQQAIQCIETAARLSPDDDFLQVAPNLVLPFVYQTYEEINFYRQRYLKGYDLLGQLMERAIEQPEMINFKSAEKFMNYYLCYQGFNDRAIHKRYGKLIHKLTAEDSPKFAAALSTPPLRNGKIRIGYIAESLGNNSETRWAVGWLKNHDRSQFEIYCYSIDSTSDLRTGQFKILSDVFHHLPNNLEATCEQIRLDQLHVLVFLSLGNRPKTTLLASLRLAPIQCSAWGHPVTSGLPTIDYFLTSDLMEPENAQEHYTEQLMRLPNIGLCYPKPSLPEPTKTRFDFGLREDAVIYLSCQLLFKYLPQHDYLFTEIVRRVPNAQLVFVIRSTAHSQSNPSLERQFQKRLQKAFADAGLRLEDHAVFLPGQDLQGYASLLSCADVFLDTLAFSGGHTTLEAIAANLPVVCCPGELMRGRQSYGALKLLGVTDTIAHTEAEYIEIAVRLGLEPEWREAIVQRMSESHANLFDDRTCVLGLEEFYRQAVHGKLAQQEMISSNTSEVPSNSSNLKSILHVGCGPYHPEALPEVLRTPEWREVRLDINPAVAPDILGSITDLSAVPDQSVDAVYSSHNLEHIYAHEVPIALSEFYRVVKPGGFALITLPDIQEVAQAVAEGKLEETLYVSPAGPISAIDILYGLRTAIADGNEFMAHRTAFTGETLSQKLHQAGFTKVKIHKDGLNLWARGHKE